jgi:Spy/CpxP family protein refolding chaperone
MFRLCAVVAVLAVTLLAGGLVMGDDKKDTPPPRGTLPANWKKLGLSDEQLQQVYRIRGQYRAKIEALRRQINDLRRDERTDLEKLLTDSQRARLREIRSGETGSRDTGPASKDRTEPRPPAKEKTPGR